jgi:hypothetical protein
MKKIKNTLKIVSIILFGTIILVGCNQVELDENPEGILSPESFFKAEGDFEAILAGGVYKPLYQSWTGFGFNSIFVLTSGAEDMAGNAGRFAQFDRLEADGDTGEMTGMWAQLYQSITNANAIIANIEKGRDSGVSDSALVEYEGQAKFMRALAYFYMVRWWGEVQLITEENINEASTTRQSPVADIYAQIVNDLQFAEDNLGSLQGASFTGKASKEAAQTVLAKVYLTMAGWPLKDNTKYALARDKAKQVMDSGLLSLEPDFANLWKQANRFTNSEFIFAFHGDINNNPSTQHVSTRFWGADEGGWGDISSETRFFNDFPDSYRKDISFTSVFKNGQTFEEAGTKPYIAKYRDAGPQFSAEANGGNAEGDGSFNLFRYAEVLLIFAEASNMAEGSPSNKALEAINKVRRRGNHLDPNTPNAAVDLTSSLSHSEFDAAVIAERNWELAFEAKRWFDLVRREMVVEVNQALYPSVSETDVLMAKPNAQVSILDGYLDQNNGY